MTSLFLTERFFWRLTFGWTSTGRFF